MTLEVLNCDQGGPEWFQARAGIVTASEFDSVLASGKGGAPSKTRQTYMYKLAGEILTGEVVESYTNGHMERGNVMEQEACDYYAFMNDCELETVGFMRNGPVGYSPDRLIGDNGLLEVKTKLPHLLIPLVLSDEFPAEHKAQCQGGLWVSGREWIDLICYWPKMPPVIRRAYRDEVYIKTIEDGVARFLEDMQQLLGRLRQAA